MSSGDERPGAAGSEAASLSPRWPWGLWGGGASLRFSFRFTFLLGLHKHLRKKIVDVAKSMKMHECLAFWKTAISAGPARNFLQWPECPVLRRPP